MDPTPLNLATDDDITAVDDIEPADLLYDDIDAEGADGERLAPPAIAEPSTDQYEYSPADDDYKVDLTDHRVEGLNDAAIARSVGSERPR
ncbi:MAG: hypothetical protein JWM93_1906 [Frankiales bacterium]|nr:hypothetical protein [Frankiales bacterium]